MWRMGWASPGGPTGPSGDPTRGGWRLRHRRGEAKTYLDLSQFSKHFLTDPLLIENQLSQLVGARSQKILSIKWKLICSPDSADSPNS